ncbi:MAG: trypsin-like serine protease [Chloroflexota bacterium]
MTESSRVPGSSRIVRVFSILALLAMLATALQPGESLARIQHSPRIVGGSEVPAGTYRFMAYLRIGSYLCGGSLIDATHILTAAHCAKGASASSITAYIGGGTVSGGVPTGSIVRTASAVAVHPQYRSSSMVNDAAVITLSQPVPSAANGGIDPISFVPSGSTLGLAENQLLTVAGWGTTSSGGSLPGKLMAVDVPVQTDAYCKQQYRLTDAQVAAMFCAGPKEGGKDSCQGDSGGPIFFLNNGVYTQVGIVSWGTGCAWAGYPGVYSRVAAPAINSFIAGFLAPAPPPSDVTAPSVAITSPVNGTTSGSAVTVEVSATDAGSGVAGVALRMCQLRACRDVGVDSAAPYSFKLTLKPGQYTFTATATDRAGNSATSSAVTISVAKTAGKAAVKADNASRHRDAGAARGHTDRRGGKSGPAEGRGR